MEHWKEHFELASSIVFFIATIIGYFAFKYRYDANVRDLYIENCKNLQKILKNFTGSNHVNIELIQEASNVLSESKLYLHSDIINLNEKVLNLLSEYYPISKRLSDNSFLDEETRLNKIHRQSKIELELDDLYKNSYKIYRKHIIQNPIERIKIRLQEFVSWLKSKVKRRIDAETSSR